MSKIECYNSLVSLSVGDATGENQMHLLPPRNTGEYYKAGNVAALRNPADPYGLERCAYLPWTDDTHLAIGVYRTLCRFGTIDQEKLAREFAKNFREDTQRGYGRGTFGLLKVYQYAPDDWKFQSQNWWGPNVGSRGNGSAMRDSIIGPFFDFDLGLVVKEARASAEVTHYHDEAIAGSIAVAVAAAVATQSILDDYWSAILKYTPAGVVRDAIELVSSPKILAETNWGAVVAVGNGKKVTALDTVPFALWQAYQALISKDYAAVMNSIIEVGGDTDTVGAMVGGIIGNTVPPPQEYIDQTEPLPTDLKML